MPTTYEKAGKDVLGLIEQVMKRHHGKLYGLGVKIGCLMAQNADDVPVKVNGYPCLAKVKIVGLKDRAHGMADAEIIVDAKEWDDLQPASQAAVIDHELTHLEPKEKAGKPQTDDLGRPKLKMKLHDWQLGGFESIAKRYAADAIEVQAAQHFSKNYGQLVLWADDKALVG